VLEHEAAAHTTHAVTTPGRTVRFMGRPPGRRPAVPAP
jgi:hypothetical protein